MSVSNEQFAETLSRLRTVVGSASLIFRQPARMATYRNCGLISVEDSDWPLAAVIPNNVQQLQAVLQIAAQTSVPVRPVLPGEAFGFFAPMARDPYELAIDLKHLNSVFSVDGQTGEVALEPGVTWWQLAEGLTRSQEPLRLPPLVNPLMSVVLTGAIWRDAAVGEDIFRIDHALDGEDERFPTLATVRLPGDGTASVKPVTFSAPLQWLDSHLNQQHESATLMIADNAEWCRATGNRDMEKNHWRVTIFGGETERASVIQQVPIEVPRNSLTLSECAFFDASSAPFHTRVRVRVRGDGSQWLLQHRRCCNIVEQAGWRCPTRCVMVKNSSWMIYPLSAHNLSELELQAQRVMDAATS